MLEYTPATPGMNEPRLAVGVPRESESVAGTVPDGVAGRGGDDVVRDALDRHVAGRVTRGDRDRVRADVAGAVGSARAVGDRVAAVGRGAGDDGLVVVAGERERAPAVPCVIVAPSSGEVIAIVGAIGSVTPLSSSARPRSRPVPTGVCWLESQPGMPTAATLTPLPARSPRPATFQPAWSPQRKPPPPISSWPLPAIVPTLTFAGVLEP